MMADLVAAGARTLTFVRSRHGAEQTALSAQRRLAETAPELVDKVAAYRGGYLPEERRELERALGCGELMGVASTNALELGVDIAGLDAAVLAGYPGNAGLGLAAGRPGRPPGQLAAAGRWWSSSPGTTRWTRYLVHHPETVFGRPMEAAVIDPTNPFILGPHLACAAAERHLTEADLELFGGESRSSRCWRIWSRAGCCAAGPTGYFWAEPGHPADSVDLRGGGGGQVAIVDEDTAGCSAPSTCTGRRPPCTPAPCTCTAARATSCRTSTCAPGSRWSARNDRTGRRSPGPRRPCR